MPEQALGRITCTIQFLSSVALPFHRIKVSEQPLGGIPLAKMVYMYMCTPSFQVQWLCLLRLEVPELLGTGWDSLIVVEDKPSDLLCTWTS